ncbi:MAG: SCO family protein [Alphaproteobacteria bacterium]|nr:SCO family protein [Alphaproteobacteria bacterium]
MNWRLLRIALYAAVAGLAGVVLARLWIEHNAASPAGPGRGEALIGGAFELTDHTGRRVTDQSYRGRPMVLFFGFTHCPDVCPTELAAIAGALDLLGNDAAKVAPIFVTVDPARDTPQVLADYLGNLHPGLIGLTGSEADIARAAKAYRVFYAVNRPKDGEGYSVDHSGLTYVMNREGKYVAHFRPGTAPETIAQRLRTLLQS